jgi:hypothetical protein
MLSLERICSSWEGPPAVAEGPPAVTRTIISSCRGPPAAEERLSAAGTIISYRTGVEVEARAER